MAPHSSPLAWKIPWTEEPGGLQSMGSRRVGQDWATSLSLFTFMHWRRKWQPTPVFLPRESQGRGSLVGCRLWGRTESEKTEETYQPQQQQQQEQEGSKGRVWKDWDSTRGSPWERNCPGQSTTTEKILRTVPQIQCAPLPQVSIFYFFPHIFGWLF